MRILVTGGAGFVGSHVVDALLAAGAEVRVLDVLHPAAHAGEDPPSYLDPRAEWVHADVRDADAVHRALAGVEAVSHQAAMVGHGVDLEDVGDYVAHNAIGTAVLLRALHRRGFAGRLVLASSMVIYGEGRFTCAAHGDVAPGPRREADLAAGRFDPPCPACGMTLAPGPVGEDARPDPRSVYAATKLHQEHLCAVWARETGATATVLRYHNAYGSRMPSDTPYAGVAALFRSALAAGRAPRVFEDGRQLRDFVHVADVARANARALLAEPPVAGPVNVCSGTPRSVGQLAAELARACGPDAPAPVVSGGYRLGDVRHVFADPTRAQEALGFRAETPWAAGIADFAAGELRAAP